MLSPPKTRSESDILMKSWTGWATRVRCSSIPCSNRSKQAFVWKQRKAISVPKRAEVLTICFRASRRASALRDCRPLAVPILISRSESFQGACQCRLKIGPRVQLVRLVKFRGNPSARQSPHSALHSFLDSVSVESRCAALLQPHARRRAIMSDVSRLAGMIPQSNAKRPRIASPHLGRRVSKITRACDACRVSSVRDSGWSRKH